MANQTEKTADCSPKEGDSQVWVLSNTTGCANRKHVLYNGVC